MSAFGNNEKDEMYESIKKFIIEKKKQHPDITTSDIMNELFEVIGYAVKSGFYEIENQ